MKKQKTLLFTILLLPVFVVSQNNNREWLTPYANVEFSDSLIVYSVSLNAVTGTNRLLPKYFDKHLLKVILTPTAGNVSSNDVFRSREAIMDYLNTEPVTFRSNVEQEEYLRLASMVLIWDLELDNHALTELESLKQSKSTNIKKNTELILQLQEVYKGLRD